MKKHKFSKLLIFTLILAMLTPAILHASNNTSTVDAATTIKINKTKLTLYVGKTYELRITGTTATVTWSSSNKSVATVTSQGKVKAKKAGTATITAIVNSKKYTCKVTVKKAASTTPTPTPTPTPTTAPKGPDMSGMPSFPEGNGVPGGMMGGGAVDKSGDTVLQTMIADVVGKFKQFEYTDSNTGETLPYNLYIPTNYDSSKSYPLVLFIADSSVVGRDTTAPLTQGYGGIIWATDEEQAKHESFVLVPEFPKVILDDHGSFTTTDYIEMTVRLLNSITSSYNIDTNRLYGTGQSMGCMTIMLLSAEHPDLFTAELFVSGQWDISTLSNLSSQKFFYIAAAGDDKASAGQIEVEDMLQNAGVSFSKATWDATWSADKLNTAVSSILKEGNSKNFATFKLGTVLPEGDAIGTSEHMYSFDYAYKIEAVRDWLFNQTK